MTFPEPDLLTLTATAIIYIMAVIATVTDVRNGKVYNWLTVPGALLGIGLNVAFAGVDGLLVSLGGMAVGLAVWFVMPLIGRPLGGGDIKFFVAIGALLGPRYLLYVMLLSFLWAGLLAVVLALRHRRLLASVKLLAGWMLLPREVRRETEGWGMDTAAPGVRVPFALATGLAAVTATLMMHYPALH